MVYKLRQLLEAKMKVVIVVSLLAVGIIAGSILSAEAGNWICSIYFVFNIYNSGDIAEFFQLSSA